MTVYRSISDSRLSSGRLWLPDMTFQLMRNDVALLGTTFGNPNIPSTAQTATDATYVNIGEPIHFHWPDDWTDDTSLLDMEIVLTFTVRVANVTGSPETGGNIRIQGGDDVVAFTSATTPLNATLTRTYSGVQTGWDTIQLQVGGNASNSINVTIDRDAATWNASDCRIYVQEAS